MPTFDVCDALGREGVGVAMAWLGRVPGSRGVVDLQDDARWRKAGADLLWLGPVATPAIEVKVERAWTGNLALETYSVVERKVPGWYWTSHAAAILYGFVDTGEWWVLDLPALRDALGSSGLGSLRAESARTPGRGRGHTTVFRLLPHDHAVAAGAVVRLGVDRGRRWVADLGGLGTLARIGAMGPSVEVSHARSGARGVPVAGGGGASCVAIACGRARIELGENDEVEWHFPPHSCGLERAPCALCGGRRRR